MNYLTGGITIRGIETFKSLNIPCCIPPLLSKHQTLLSPVIPKMLSNVELEMAGRIYHKAGDQGGQTSTLITPHQLHVRWKTQILWKIYSLNSLSYLLYTPCCSSSPTGQSRLCLRWPAPAPWRQIPTPTWRPPPGIHPQMLMSSEYCLTWVLHKKSKKIPHRSLEPSSRSAEPLPFLSATLPSAQCIPSCSSLRQRYWLPQASAPFLWSNEQKYAILQSSSLGYNNNTWRNTPTCPNTSSLTVKVRSSMSSMSLSFIHCRDWWNSSSRYSRSLRSQGLQDERNPCSFMLASLKRVEILCCNTLHTCAKVLYRKVWWRRRPAGTGGSEPNPEYDH